jgi:uncharacterized protein (DUF2141 family)
MLYRTVISAAVALIMACSASAETYGEKVKDVDADKKTITIAVEGKETTFKVDDKVDVQSQVRAGKRLRLTPIKDGLKGVKVGVEATITTEKRAGEEIVTKIVVLVPEKK